MSVRVTVSMRRTPIVSVIKARGDLDFREVRDIARVIRALADRGQKKILIDWSEADIVNPIALGPLLKAQIDLADDGGVIKLARMNRIVRGAFWKSADNMFESYATLEDALLSFDDEWNHGAQGRDYGNRHPH